MSFELSIIDLFYVFVPGAIYTTLWSALILPLFSKGVSDLKIFGDSFLTAVFIAVSLFVGFFLQESWILLKKQNLKIFRWRMENKENEIFKRTFESYKIYNFLELTQLSEENVEEIKCRFIYTTNNYCWMEGKQGLIQNFSNRAAFWGTMFSGTFLTFLLLSILLIINYSYMINNHPAIILICLGLTMIFSNIFYSKNKQKEYRTILDHQDVLRSGFRKVIEREKMKYIGGGAILIIKNTGDGKVYLALVKRKKIAGIKVKNPEKHSGFFGGSESGTIEENLPRYATYRELLEELLIIHNGVASGVVTPKIDLNKVSKATDFTKNLFELWSKKTSIDLTKPKYKKINAKEIRLLDYPESKVGRKSVSVLKINLPIEKCKFFDGELKNDGMNPNNLIDRKIDLIELKKFKKWFNEKNKKPLDADYSYQSGSYQSKKEIKLSKIKKLSPSLIKALEEWNFSGI